MKDDTISRQAAIQTAERMYRRCGTSSIEDYHDLMVDALTALPSAQPGWIPVTERLPKPNEYENGVRKYYLVQNEYGDMMVCSWNGRYWVQMYGKAYVKDKVTAWMPLPKPWEGEKS